MVRILRIHFFICFLGFVAARSNGGSQQHIYSPASRNPKPHSVYKTVGKATTRTKNGDLSLEMHPESHVSLDFGVEVGGHVSFSIEADNSGHISLAFSESPQFVRPISDDTGAIYTEDWDRTLNVTLPSGHSLYRTPKDWFRGGFRFLTINSKTHVAVSNISCEIGFAPNMPDLRDYSGYFHGSGKQYDLLNRLWYAGAYTVQTNIAPQNTGRYLPQVFPGWDYNSTLGTGPGPFLLDGAKRDRAIWPGDLGISGTTAFLAFGSQGLEAFHNSLETLFYFQNASTGEFPFAGPDTASFQDGSQSDTYHVWGLISMYEYFMYSGDQEWLNLHWSNITRGIEYTMKRLHSKTCLQNQTQPNDWGRQGGGGYNSVLNALNYHMLVSMSSLSTSTKQTERWAHAADCLKQGYNKNLWDEDAGLYRDNTTTSLHPQDGNSLALLYNLTVSKSQAEAISDGLLRNWNFIGPVTPELPDTISPFISGLEVLAHYRAGQPGRGMQLMERLWSYLLEGPQFTGSTLVEGITANGSLYYRSTAGYDYDAAYTSLSHGWSTAPLQVLMFEVLGLKITGAGGNAWTLSPEVAGLGAGELGGGFVTGLGRFGVRLVISRNQSRAEATVEAPQGTTGQIVLSSGWAFAEVNGKKCVHSCKVKGGRLCTVTYSKTSL